MRVFVVTLEREVMGTDLLQAVSLAEAKPEPHPARLCQRLGEVCLSGGG